MVKYLLPILGKVSILFPTLHSTQANHVTLSHQPWLPDLLGLVFSTVYCHCVYFIIIILCLSSIVLLKSAAVKEVIIIIVVVIILLILYSCLFILLLLLFVEDWTFLCVKCIL